MFQGRKSLMAMITAKKLLCQCSICRAEATQRTTTMGTSTTINHRTTHSPPLYTFHGRKVFFCWLWPLMAMITAKKLLCQWKFAEPKPHKKTTTLATNTTINRRTTHSPPLYISPTHTVASHTTTQLQDNGQIRQAIRDLQRERITVNGHLLPTVTSCSELIRLVSQTLNSALLTSNMGPKSQRQSPRNRPSVRRAGSAPSVTLNSPSLLTQEPADDSEDLSSSSANESDASADKKVRSMRSNPSHDANQPVRNTKSFSGERNDDMLNHVQNNNGNVPGETLSIPVIIFKITKIY
jgi:hypothetical protein